MLRILLFFNKSFSLCIKSIYIVLQNAVFILNPQIVKRSPSRRLQFLIAIVVILYSDYVSSAGG